MSHQHVEENVHHLEVTEWSSDEETDTDQLVEWMKKQKISCHLYLDPIVGAKMSSDSVHEPTGS